MQLNRVEVLHPGRNRRRQYWRNQEGSISVIRRAGEDVWTAVVDGVLVADSQRTVLRVDGSTLHTTPLCASTIADLVDLIALQEHIHLLCDDSMEWAEDAAGWPVALQPTYTDAS
jgi:hypothetical protein